MLHPFLLIHFKVKSICSFTTCPFWRIINISILFSFRVGFCYWTLKGNSIPASRSHPQIFYLVFKRGIGKTSLNYSITSCLLCIETTNRYYWSSNVFLRGSCDITTTHPSKMYKHKQTARVVQCHDGCQMVLNYSKCIFFFFSRRVHSVKMCCCCYPSPFPRSLFIW